MAATTPRKKTSRRPEDRRRDLMDAAVRVFSAKGVHGATVADIAERAGVAKGTFYLYFDSREHLLGALRQQLVTETVARVARFYERVGHEDWWGLVDSMLESMIDLMIEQRDAILVFTRDGLTPDTADIFAGCDRQLNEMVAAGIQAGVDAGVFQVADPNLMGTLLHHAIEGTLMEAILYKDGFDRDELVRGAKELVHKALSPSP